MLTRGGPGFAALDAAARARQRAHSHSGMDRAGSEQLPHWLEPALRVHEPLPNGGEKVVLGVDRYMSFLEIRNQPKSVDYPFTLVQLHLDKDMTKSEGKLAAFTMITFDKKKQALELENYGTEPVRLANFVVEKK